MWRYTTQDQIDEFLLSLNLLNMDDKKAYINKLYAISNNIENNYRVFQIKKRSGKLRTIYEPDDSLKHIQRMILKNILENKSISKYAKAYHSGISLRENALPHTGKKIVLKLDIKDFFDNITFVDIYNSCFPIEYFPKSVGMLLTYLCTYDDHLVQGAPTSAYISNLVMKEFDEVIGDYVSNLGVSYTRYSDDMTFSGDFNPSDIVKKVSKMLIKLNLILNKGKIVVITENKNQSVTGLTVNEYVQVNRKYRDKIRQEIYYINKYGIDSHIKKIGYTGDTSKYWKSLYGRILYVLQINREDKEFIKYKEYVKGMLIKY